MDTRQIEVKVKIDDGISKLNLTVNEYDDAVEIIFFNVDEVYSASGDDHFSAMLDLRRQLEDRGISLLCNASAPNVYPSPMQFSMGNTKKAYKKRLGHQAFNKDLVDIFGEIEVSEFGSIDEQEAFQVRWIKSLRK